MAGLSTHFEKKIMRINDDLPGVTLDDLRTINRGHIRYTVYPHEDYMKEDISALELSVRSTNGLKRAGYRDVESLASAVSCNADLAGIRSLGRKSIEEIMLGLFLYQYESLKEERKKSYINDLLRLNTFILS